MGGGKLSAAPSFLFVSGQSPAFVVLIGRGVVSSKRTLERPEKPMGQKKKDGRITGRVEPPFGPV